MKPTKAWAFRTKKWWAITYGDDICTLHIIKIDAEEALREGCEWHPSEFDNTHKIIRVEIREVKKAK